MAFKVLVDNSEKTLSTLGDAAKASFVESNWIAAGVAYGKSTNDYIPTTEELELAAAGKHDYKSYVKPGHEEFAVDYAQTRSKREAIALSIDIDKHLKGRAAMAEHPVTSFITGAVGAALSLEQLPIYMIPGGGIISNASLIRTGIKSAQIGAASAAVAEVTVGDLLPVRNGEEVLYAVGGSAAFSTVIGSLAKAAGNVAEVTAAVKKLDDSMIEESNVLINNLGVAEDFYGVTDPRTKAAVAKKVDAAIADGSVVIKEGITREMIIDQEVGRMKAESTMVKHPQLYRAIGFINPAVRFATSKLPGAREFGLGIVDSPLLRNGVEIGPSAQLVIAQQSAEVLTKVPSVNRARYKEYLDATPTERLSPEEFSKEVSRAMSKGDKHDNPFVQAAAADIRKALAPIEERLLEVGIINKEYDGFQNLRYEDTLHIIGPREKLKYYKEDGTPRKNIAKLLDSTKQEILYLDNLLTRRAKTPLGDLSYLPRKFELTKIRGDRQGFHEKLKQVFREDFTAKERQRADGLRISIEEQRVKLGDDVEIPKGRSRKDIPKGQRRTSQQILADKEVELRELEIEIDKGIAVHEDELDAVVSELSTVIMAERAHSTHRIESHKAGIFKGRTFDIASSRIDDWLEMDVEKVWAEWTKQVVPDLVLKEKFGDVDAITARDTVGKQYDVEATRLDNDGMIKEAKVLRKEKERFMKDSKAMVEILRNRFAPAQDPSGMLHKSFQYLRWGAMVNNLGMMTVSAIPDIGIIIARQGLNAVKFGNHVVGFSPEVKANRELLRQLGVMADVFTSHRIEAINMLDSNFALTNKVDRLAHKAVQKFNQLTVMNHWNAQGKSFVAGIYAFGIIDDAAKLAAGKMSKKQLQRYAANGLSEADLKALARITKPGGKYIPDWTTWKDQGLAERFKMTLFKEADNVIITPGAGDLPLTARTAIGKIMFQFKSFAMAANHRLLLTNIDDMTAQKVIGIMSMAWFGYMSYATKQLLKGEEIDTDPQVVMKESLDRSGVGALWLDGNAMMEKATKGNLSIYKALGLEGEPSTIYQSSSIVEALAGPSAGILKNLSKVATAVTSGEVKESDVRAARRLIYLNNWILTHKAFTEMEKVVYDKLK